MRQKGIPQIGKLQIYKMTRIYQHRYLQDQIINYQAITKYESLITNKDYDSWKGDSVIQQHADIIPFFV